MPLKIHPHIYRARMPRDSNENANCGHRTPVLTRSLSKNASKLPTRFREEPYFQASLKIGLTSRSRPEISEVQDPDLARIVASWDCLTDEVKSRLIKIIETDRTR
jgi:hypothetical protein